MDGVVEESGFVVLDLQTLNLKGGLGFRSKIPPYCGILISASSFLFSVSFSVTIVIITELSIRLCYADEVGEGIHRISSQELCATDSVLRSSTKFLREGSPLHLFSMNVF